MEQCREELSRFREALNQTGGRSVRIYRSKRSFIGLGAMCLLLTLAVGIFQSQMMHSPEGLTAGGRALSIAPALAWLNLVRMYLDNVWVLRHRLVMFIHGRLSLSFATPVVYYIDIREIQVFQGVLGRLLNYGDIAIGTAAGVTIRMKGIRRPEVVARFIERMRILALTPKHPIHSKAA